jgi:hypothetical protein
MKRQKENWGVILSERGRFWILAPFEAKKGGGMELFSIRFLRKT